MKKERLKGFALGIAVMVLLFGLTISAFAANKSIEIDDGIKVLINNAAFTPKDSKGNPALVFTYNGTTYVPARSLSEALGFTVSYDSTSRTASVISGSKVSDPIKSTDSTVTAPDSSGYIGEARAKAIALQQESGLTVVKCTLDIDHNKAVYEIELRKGFAEYDCEIDAVSGKVLKWEMD